MRLTAFVPGRLTELGWCERIMELSREHIRNHSASGPGIMTGAALGANNLPEPSDVPVEAIVEAIKEEARLLIPQQLHTELINRIMEFIGEHNLD